METIFLENKAYEKIFSYDVDFFNIRQIHNELPKKLLFMVLKEFPDDIRYIQDPSEEMKWYCIDKDPNTIQYIQNPSEEMKLKLEKISIS